MVSGFAGGMVESTQKAPQVTLNTEAHEGGYILIEHMGGDPLDTGSVKVRTYIPAGTYSDITNIVSNWKNQTYCPTNQNLYTSSWAVFQPGDQIKIAWNDAFAESKWGGYMAPSVGESLNVEIYDTLSGNIIVSGQTTVLP